MQTQLIKHPFYKCIHFKDGTTFFTKTNKTSLQAQRSYHVKIDKEISKPCEDHSTTKY